MLVSSGHTQLCQRETTCRLQSIYPRQQRVVVHSGAQLQNGAAEQVEVDSHLRG